MNRFAHGGDVWHGSPGDWLDFSSNTNALGCPDFVRQAMLGAMDEVAYYPQVSMERAIRGLRRMLSVSPECVLPTNGGIGALELAITTHRLSRVVAVTPAFVEYERIARKHGIPFAGVSMLKDRHTVAFPVEMLEKTLQSGDMLIVCNPSNPIGYGADHDVMAQVLALTETRQAILLVDEAFIDFTEGLSVRHWVRKHPRLIVAGSLTKIFTIPGVRIGYLLAQPDSIAALKAYQTPWVLSVFADRVAAAVGMSQSFIRETVARAADARHRFKTSLEGLGLFVYDSCANYLLLDLAPIGITAAALAETLRKHHILVRDCENYEGLDAYHMRVAVKSDADNERLIDQLTQVLRGKA